MKYLVGLLSASRLSKGNPMLSSVAHRSQREPLEIMKNTKSAAMSIKECDAACINISFNRFHSTFTETVFSQSITCFDLFGAHGLISLRKHTGIGLQSAEAESTNV